MNTRPVSTHPLFAAAAAVIVAGCTASLASSLAPFTTNTLRELTADEKKVIADSLLDNIREPASAKYLWAYFPVNAPSDGQTHYCAAVYAKSPHPPYNGLQPYIVQVQVSKRKIVSSVVASIAGGNDMRIVRNLCAKHGLNPDDAA